MLGSNLATWIGAPARSTREEPDVDRVVLIRAWDALSAYCNRPRLATDHPALTPVMEKPGRAIATLASTSASPDHIPVELTHSESLPGSMRIVRSRDLELFAEPGPRQGPSYSCPRCISAELS